MPNDGAQAADQHGERLQKVLAQAGVASRRKCEEYILAGRVKVNGEVVTALGTKVRPGHDLIAFDGQPIALQAQWHYYLLYKPVGYLSTAHDPQGRSTVLDLIPGHERLYPVGRLDLESEGLLLCTDDGELTYRLTHPRFEHEKEYLVCVRGEPDERAMASMHAGLLLPDEARPMRAQVQTMPEGWRWRAEPLPPDARWLRVVLREGRKRQIRRMLEAVDCPALRLIRVRMGPLRLGQLEPGQGRWLSGGEAREIRRSVGLSESSSQAEAGKGRKRL
ncbi:MAG: rRNA pseudouridine synthase [Anaerolineae bacterium]|nr:rRNA pseudouridine synthase [Anaerolineae bacterium]